ITGGAIYGSFYKVTSPTIWAPWFALALLVVGFVSTFVLRPRPAASTQLADLTATAGPRETSLTTRGESCPGRAIAHRAGGARGRGYRRREGHGRRGRQGAGRRRPAGCYLRPAWRGAACGGRRDRGARSGLRHRRRWAGRGADRRGHRQVRAA